MSELENKRIKRLSKYLIYKGISDNQATIACGLSTGLIGKARTGRNDISLRTCNKILDKFGDLSRAWLISGEGEMLKPSQVGDKATLYGDNATILQRNAPNESVSEVERLRLENAFLKEQNDKLIDKLIGIRGKDYV